MKDLLNRIHFIFDLIVGCVAARSVKTLNEEPSRRARLRRKPKVYKASMLDVNRKAGVTQTSSEAAQSVLKNGFALSVLARRARRHRVILPQLSYTPRTPLNDLVEKKLSVIRNS